MGDDMKKSIFAFVLIAIFAGGCAVEMGSLKKPRYPTPLSEEARSAFSEAEKKYLNGSLDEARSLYKSYIDTFGYNELTDECRFKLGEIAFMKGDYRTAISFYKEAYQNIYNPRIAPRAQFKEAMTLFNMGDYAGSLDVLEKIERKDVTKILALRIDSLAVRAIQKIGRSSKANIKWYLFLLDDYDTLAEKEYAGKVQEALVPLEKVRREVLDWVKDSQVMPSEIESLPISMIKGEMAGGFIYYKLAMAHFAMGNIKEASKYIDKFVSRYPKHEFAEDGRKLLAELKGRKEKGYKVGVILPLEGKFSVYGKATLNGIQCAAGLTPPCTSNLPVELVVKDDMGVPENAVEAVRELAKEDVLAIVGPLTAECADAAALEAESLKVPMITLTTKENFVGGDYVFRHSLTPSDQASTLVKYAMENKKVKNFAVVYPSNAYGTKFMNLFKTVVEANGGKVVYKKSYDYSELAPLASEGEDSNISGVSGEEGASPSASLSIDLPDSVEAVFIPDSYKAVGYVVGVIHQSKPNKRLLYLGTNRWNDPDLTSVNGDLLEGAIFVDGFYKKGADVTTRGFVQSFVSAFGIDPTILEAHGYDALSIVATAIKIGTKSREGVARAIRNIKGVAGATGTIRMGENSNTTRRLFILTVSHGRIVEADSGGAQNQL